MQPIILFCVVLAVLGSFTEGERLGNHLSFGTSALAIRGGAKSGKIAESRAAGRRKRPIDEDEDDIDEAEEDDDDSDRPRRSGGKGKPSSTKKTAKKKGVSRRGQSGSSSKSPKKSRSQLIPWGSPSTSKNGKRKRTRSLGLKLLKDGLEGLTKTGQAAYKDFYRKAKVLKSSAFEGILLKATWPSNDPIPSELLSEIVKYSIPSFKYARSDSDDDPYYMTLHKLWTKMCEKDWRTVTKSMYILHCISRDSSTEACANFATALKDMSKTRNAKKPDHKYFELRRLTSDLDDNSLPYEAFVSSYGAFVLQRAKLFFGKFEELKNLSETASEKKVLAALKKAQTLIKAGLAVNVEKDERNVINGQAIRLVALDLKDLWSLYTEKLRPWVASDDTSGKYTESKDNVDEVKAALQFFAEYDGQVQEYLSTQSKAFAKLRVRIPAAIDDASSSGSGSVVVTAESVNARVAELLKLSGGASRRRAVIEDDDEEDDEDNDDETDMYDDDEDEYGEDADHSEEAEAEDDDHDDDQDDKDDHDDGDHEDDNVDLYDDDEDDYDE